MSRADPRLQTLDTPDMPDTPDAPDKAVLIDTPDTPDTADKTDKTDAPDTPNVHKLLPLQSSSPPSFYIGNLPGLALIPLSNFSHFLIIFNVVLGMEGFMKILPRYGTIALLWKMYHKALEQKNEQSKAVYPPFRVFLYTAI